MGVSILYDTIQGLKTKYQSLSIASAITGGFVIQEYPLYQDQDVPLPYVGIAPYGPERIADETSYRDGYWPGIAVVIVSKLDVSLETRLQWRQVLIQASNNRSIAGLPDNYNLTVEPGNVMEVAAATARKAWVSGFLVRAKTQLVRL